MSMALNVLWLILACVALLFNRVSFEAFIIFVVLMRICMVIETKELFTINVMEKKENDECK